MDCIYPWTHSRKTCFHLNQTSEFQVSNFQLFLPKCEVLLLDTAQRKDDSNQRERKKWSERRLTFKDMRNQGKKLAQDYSFSEGGRRLGCSFKNRTALHFTFRRQNSKVWHLKLRLWRHMKTCFARVRSRVDPIDVNILFSIFPVSSNIILSLIESWCNVLEDNQSFFRTKFTLRRFLEPFISSLYAKNFGTKTQFFHKPSSHIAYL